MGVHSRIPDEGLKESVWWVGITYTDRLNSKSVTSVVRLKRCPQSGMKIRVRDKIVKLYATRCVLSPRFDMIAQVKPING